LQLILSRDEFFAGVFDPLFIDSKNSSDLRFRDGFAGDSPLQQTVRLSPDFAFVPGKARVLR